MREGFGRLIIIANISAEVKNVAPPLGRRSEGAPLRATLRPLKAVFTASAHCLHGRDFGALKRAHAVSLAKHKSAICSANAPFAITPPIEHKAETRVRGADANVHAGADTLPVTCVVSDIEHREDYARALGPQ
jgi:hypothetical protein